jgi:hypothetical protein
MTQVLKRREREAKAKLEKLMRGPLTAAVADAA